MKIKQDFWYALIGWNWHKNWDTFKEMYHAGFVRNPWFGYRVWRILCNTVSGRYERIMRQVYNGKVKVVNE